MQKQTETVLITGATGYLGGLVAAAIAAGSSARLVLLVRGKHDPASVVTRIVAEAARVDGLHARDARDRITVVPMPDAFRCADIVRAVRHFSIDEMIHCAGCLSYWNPAKLHAGNIVLTKELLDAAKRLRVRRFIHLSSAFCSGYVDGPIAERLHATPRIDPCPYTASKRESEMLVAGSGLPHLIIRPSIVIGDSRDGRYGGKLCGVYQYWWAAKRYLFSRSSVIHAVAREIPLHMIHQDAFQTRFLAAYRHLPDNSIMHLVSQDGELPTIRQMWDALITRYMPDCDRRYYEHPSQIPMDQCDRQMQQFLSAVRTNAEICSRQWCFETKAIGYLKATGRCPPVEASIATLTVCQDRFLSESQPGCDEEDRADNGLQEAMEASTDVSA